MEEWRLCVSNFETTAEFWAEVMTSDLFSLHDNITFDARVLEIENFIHTKNQSQCRCPEALHELREMIIDFKILLAKLALKYLFAFVFRFFFNFIVISIGMLLLAVMIKLSVLYLTSCRTCRTCSTCSMYGICNNLHNSVQV
jgi:hypothetical protein